MPLPYRHLSDAGAMVLGQLCVSETNRLSFIAHIQKVPLRKKVRLVTLGHPSAGAACSRAHVTTEAGHFQEAFAPVLLQFPATQS